MAFNKSANNVASFGNKASQQNDSWKADGFINMYLPTKNGRRKVGYIPLKGTRALDAYILERLQAGGEEALKAFVEAIQIEYSSGEADEDNLPLF